MSNLQTWRETWLLKLAHLYQNPSEALWLPLKGPQLEAFLSPAQELFYGGSAGGGKTALLLGSAIMAHKRAIIFRREYTQLIGADGLIERSREILEGVASFNGSQHVWRDMPGGHVLELGAVQHLKDINKYKGRAHDFKGFDEVTEFLEEQYLFLIRWARTTDPEQRVRVLATGNPPTHADGEWVIRRWGPWLDTGYSNPAKPGELRWFAMIDGKDTEVENGGPFTYKGEDITPTSRTFVPARLSDNPFLADTDYESILQGAPEPLRSQLLYGDFTVGREDDPWQIIPTEWIRAAMSREPRDKPDSVLDTIGGDIARGGSDKTVISKRYGTWFAPLLKFPGSSTPDGPGVAALIVSEIDEGSDPIVNVDVIGIGASVYDSLAAHGISGLSGVNFAEATKARDKSGRLGMCNVRAEAYWTMREALDPVYGDNFSLPDDPELLADLAAPKWKLTPRGVQVESKEDIKMRLGRSPDCGDAVVLANYGGRGVFIG